MPAKLSEKKIEQIKELYNQGIYNFNEIARIVGVCKTVVRGYTVINKRINPETGKPYKNLSELYEYQARQRINPETGKPYKSLSDYNKHHDIKKDPDTGKPFNNSREYKEYILKKTGILLGNQTLGELIKAELEKIGQTQSWLAREIGVTRQSVSYYVLDEAFPNKDILKRIFSTLQSRKSLEALAS